MQVSGEVEPITGEYVPSRQVVHADDPVLDAYVLMPHAGAHTFVGVGVCFCSRVCVCACVCVCVNLCVLVCVYV